MSSTDTVSVAYCFNNAYCHIAAAAISSLISNTSSSSCYDIYVVHDDISPYNQLLLSELNNRDNVHLRFVKFCLEDVVEYDLNYQQHTKYSFLRLFLHRIFPKIERLLYLDSDTVLTADAAELYGQDLGGHALGACLDELSWQSQDLHCLVPRLKGYPYDTLHDYLIAHVGLSEANTRAYFNAGVLILSLRQAGALLDSMLPEQLARHFLMADQDILNLVFREDRQILAPTYNVFAGEQVEHFVREHGRLPAVIHYNGEHKPCDVPSMSRPGNSVYWKALAGTDFYFQALERYITARSAVSSQQMTALTIKKLLPVIMQERRS